MPLRCRNEKIDTRRCQIRLGSANIEAVFLFIFSPLPEKIPYALQYGWIAPTEITFCAVEGIVIVKADRAAQTAYLQNGSAGSANTADSCRARFFRNQVKGPDPGLNITIRGSRLQKKSPARQSTATALPGINQYLCPVCQHILPSVFIWLYDNFLSGWCLQNHSEHIGIVFPQLYIQCRSYSPMISSSVPLSLCRLPDNPSAPGTNVRYIFSSCPTQTACRALEVSTRLADCRPPLSAALSRKATAGRKPCAVRNKFP